MIEAILGAALAYFIYNNLSKGPSPKLGPAGSRNVRPHAAYAPQSSLMQKRNHPVKIVGTRTDLGRLGTPRVDAVDLYTGQILTSYSKNPNALTEFYGHNV